MNSSKRQVKLLCPYDCPSTCGLVADIENGRIVRVAKDPDHPVSHATICRKMQHYEKSINSEDRILTPLKRTGKKGSGTFEPISWDEAIECITSEWKHIIAEQGSEAIAICTYSGVMSDIQRKAGDALWNKMGVSGLVKTLCASGKDAGYQSVYGNTGALDPRELVDCDVLLVWGSNMYANRIQTLVDITPLKQQKRILIDTFANPTSRFCDETILVRGGSDGALVMAIMHELVAMGKADEDFLAAYAYGWDDFKPLLETCTPEWAEAETGVNAATIRHLAELFGNAKAPAVLFGSGASRHRNGAMTTRLVALLPAVVGAWKKGGGYCGYNPLGHRSLINADLITRPDLKTKQTRNLNINQLGQALHLTGKEAVRSLYVYGSNPANTVSDQTNVITGLEREDLFTVVHERFMTDTAKYADIILPATFSPEQSDFYRAYGYATVGVQRKVVNAPGECKSNVETFSLLAKAMGYEEECFAMTEDQLLDLVLDNPTPTVAALPEETKQMLRQGGSVSLPYANHLEYHTGTGKIQFADPALTGDYRVAHYVKDEIGEFPLHLIATPSEYTLNSTFIDRKDLIAGRGEPVMLIHPEAAAVRGIVDGQKIVAFNDLAEAVFVARVTEQIQKDNVVCPGCHQLRADQRGGNANTYNALNHPYLSDMGEATTLNGNSVDIRPADNRTFTQE